MVRNPFARPYRPAWAAAVLALLVVVTFTVAPVRSFAKDLLAIFRVQEIAFTPVDVEALPDEEALEAVAPEIERLFGESLAVMAASSSETLTEAAARERAPFPIRLPHGRVAVRHEWTPPVHIAIDIDVRQFEALFRELGYGYIELPGELDGRTVEAGFSGVLTSRYGSCEDEALQGNCATFVQMASPSVSAPDGLEVDQLGRIYLELLGLPAEEAAELSRQIDWTSTLVLPFPHHVGLTHEALSLDGVEATLIYSESSYRPAPEYLITWVKNDVIYALAGQGDYSQALELIASLD
jgi:hypothetical protein